MQQLAESRLSLGEALILGGQCGFDSVLSQLVCVCDDKPCPFPLCLPPEANNGNSNLGMNIGLPIGGAVLVGIGLGWLIFYCRQKRKLRLATASTPTASKDVLTPLSSEDPSTPPSTKFTKSIPSYPFSKSDLGRDSTYFGVQVFNYSELEEATNKFDPSKELGDGGFGTVYYDKETIYRKFLIKCKSSLLTYLFPITGVLSDGRVVAVKRLYKNNFKHVEQFMNEVEILTQLNIAIETAETLAYLHKSDIIHRDVKTNNILLDNDFHVKVADFGLSRLFPLDATLVSTAPQGTPGYVDPEYYQCYQLTEKSNVYSFGVVLIELISSLQAVDTNRHRHDINLANMAVNKIQNHTLHELVDSTLGFEKNTTQEKDMRPSMEEVLKVLKGIKNEDLNAHKVEIVDILVDDETGPLKSSVAPPSPDSVAASG
ncbi:non-specific serine/threonine protein kinase [Salvia divinorum]|uniref:Non-specific serine/threonine protein kinase n=1 Tax=Salvia divinorum TaxID=28513 RepID=A0ABD1FXA7_SALDI